MLLYEKDKLSEIIVFSGGVTIHQAFGFKWGNNHHDGLSDKKLAHLRFMLSELKIIIIDEVSLLSSDMLYRIHMRVCEIFQSKKPFGGKIVFLVGDLLQVKNSWYD